MQDKILEARYALLLTLVNLNAYFLPSKYRYSEYKVGSGPLEICFGSGLQNLRSWFGIGAEFGEVQRQAFTQIGRWYLQEYKVFFSSQEVQKRKCYAAATLLHLQLIVLCGDFIDWRIIISNCMTLIKKAYLKKCISINYQHFSCRKKMAYGWCSWYQPGLLYYWHHNSNPLLVMFHISDLLKNGNVDVTYRKG